MTDGVHWITGQELREIYADNLSLDKYDEIRKRPAHSGDCHYCDRCVETEKSKASAEARKDERKRYACNLETIQPPKDCFSHFEGYNSIKCKGCSQWGYCADITVRCTAAREDEQRKWRDEHPGDLVWMTPEEEEARIRRDEREKVLEKKSKLIRDVISKDQSGLAEIRRRMEK